MSLLIDIVGYSKRLAAGGVVAEALRFDDVRRG